MLGAIAGDIIGSVYEGKNFKIKDFPLFNRECRFTDDTVLTVAVADVILNANKFVYTSKYTEQFQWYYRRYAYAGYGRNFREWAKSNSNEPYKSYGNGAAMRVSPIGFAFNDLDTVLREAQRSAEVTHSHPEGIKGAQAIAAAIFLARLGEDKVGIKSYIQATFGYDLRQTLNQIRPTYQYDSSCQGSVPQAIIAFLESTDFEDAIRNAVSIGGDSDTIACMTGAIAQAFYGGVPEAIAQLTLSHLNEHLCTVTEKFMFQFCT
ncbi:ADP-ribosylglycohydrolase family protein [Nostoc sp. CENA67]|uniref:ADP-ribosylglycohydrolase family protein n=1 Tax=Amazonocrinis nigriterrae CENA67 TaxID=2794033 RepID=A0A8J7HP92_9NOST|nr:ADP-ribosylglycohydrolase family protein [Amazonocrinis nigriterrae]MBH8563037.1 ADP-ribosylglycohydrolase family protein [Amazonocrinis nigriterrae CENA67]